MWFSNRSDVNLAGLLGQAERRPAAPVPKALLSSIRYTRLAEPHYGPDCRRIGHNRHRCRHLNEMAPEYGICRSRSVQHYDFE